MGDLQLGATIIIFTWARRMQIKDAIQALTGMQNS